MKALVTGGCSGLGREFTRELIKRGYEVYATYNSSVDNALDLENEYVDKIKCIKCNIKHENEIDNLFFNIDNVDLIINNAAISKDDELENKTKKDFMEVLEVNVVGTFLVTKYGLDNLNNNGIIINISSNNALSNYNPISIDYDVSKAGVNMLTKDFSVFLNEKNRNNKIISICPGWINTDAVINMNQSFLDEELIRSNQSELLDKTKLVNYILDNISNYKNGDVIEIKEV